MIWDESKWDGKVKEKWGKTSSDQADEILQEAQSLTQLLDDFLRKDRRRDLEPQNRR